MLTIGSFGYDPVDQCLWKDGQRIELTPKTHAVLACLVSRAGRLVTKEELIRTVWPEVCVTDAVLKVRIAELRKCLGDAPGKRRFIETLHRRGYRLIAPVGHVDDPANRNHRARRDPDHGAARAAEVDADYDGVLVGRERSLDRLIRRLVKADAGERQLVFVTGEAGAGKTALLHAFRERIAPRADVRVATGQCVEHHGAQEALLPVLDALEKLCRGDEDECISNALRRYAPTWLAQIPWLLRDSDRDSLAKGLLGATRSRMSREFGTFCEIISRERTIVLVLEDLHWCDHATVELLSWLASQQGAARLLVIVSLRPAQLSAHAHPLETLQRRLALRNPASRIPLEPLDVSDIALYLRHRLSERSGQEVTREATREAAREADMARWLHRRTSGNPLFVVNLVSYLQEQGLRFDPDSDPAFAAHGRQSAIDEVVPDSLRSMIAAQIERLEPLQRELLLAASIAGELFCAEALSAALGEDAESLDEACRRLAASGQFIRHVDLCELPDATLADRYTFIHVLYRDALSQSLSARRRTRLHRRIGTYKARLHAGATHAIAAELVTHFKQAGEPLQVVRFLRESADNALARYANREAVRHLTEALTLLDRVPSERRVELEPELLEQRGLVFQAMAEMPAAVEDFERWLHLARAAERVDAQVAALLRLASALSWIDRERCLAVVDEARRRCRHVEDEVSRLSALGSCAYWNLLWRRWDAGEAEDALSAAASARARVPRSGSGAMLSRASYFLCLRGDYARAADMSREGMSIALLNGDSSEYLLGLYFRCWALLHAGRWDLFIDCLDEQAFRIADSNDHQFWNLLFTLLRSWLEEICGDHDSALRSASSALAQAERQALPFGRLLGLVRLGFACQGLGHESRACDAFVRCESWLAGERVLMDWIVSIPMHHGLSRHWLGTGDFERARAAAESALRLAEGPGERTYMAAALDTLATIAVATDDLPGAEAALARAFRVLEEGEAPTVLWRIHATSAALAEARGDTRRAAEHWSRSARTLERLARALERRPALRQSFESRASVRAVLSRGRRLRESEFR